MPSLLRLFGSRMLFARCNVGPQRFFATAARRNTKGPVGAQLIGVMNKLQEVLAISGTNTRINLPQIVVCGGQSSGKSSVIENLVGHDFLPRGRDLVTRCPIIIQMTPDTGDEDDYATFTHSGDKKFQLEDVADEIRRQTDKIGSLADCRALLTSVCTAGDNKQIVADAIVLQLHLQDTVPLTLVDMPGLTRVPVGNQPADIESRIRSVILKYIRPSNAIILAVHAANQDVATSDALNLAKSVDGEAERTIGVLTKIDLMDKGTSPVGMLSGVEYPLRLGFYGIRARSHEDTQSSMPIAEALAREAEFFSTARFSSVRSNVGTKQLALRCGSLLASHIREHLPDVRKQLQRVEREARSILERYGDGVPSASSDKAAQGWYLMHVLNGYASEFKLSIDGGGQNILADRAVGGARLRQVFHDRFTQDLEQISPLRSVADSALRSALRNAAGASPALFVPQRAFEALSKKIIEELRPIARRCVALAADELRAIAARVAQSDDVVRHAALRRALDETANTLIDKSAAEATRLVDTMIDCELSYINTNHPDFIGGAAALGVSARNTNNNNNTNANQARKPEMSSSSPPSSNSNAQEGAWFSRIFASSSSSSSSSASASSNNTVRNTTSNAAQARATSVAEREDMQVELMRNLLTSYFEIVRGNVRDMTPKFVMHSLVRSVQNNLQETLVAELYRENDFNFLLQESPEAVQAREKAKSQLAAAAQAQTILNNSLREIERAT